MLKRLCHSLGIDREEVHRLQVQFAECVRELNRAGKAAAYKREIDKILDPLVHALLKEGYSEHEIWG